MSGTVSDNAGNSGLSFASTSGQAHQVTIGAGWPDFFNGLSTFTFMTDAYGNGSWHVNIKEDPALVGAR